MKSIQITFLQTFFNLKPKLETCLLSETQTKTQNINTAYSQDYNMEKKKLGVKRQRFFVLFWFGGGVFWGGGSKFS